MDEVDLHAVNQGSTIFQELKIIHIRHQETRYLKEFNKLIN